MPVEVKSEAHVQSHGDLNYIRLKTDAFAKSIDICFSCIPHDYVKHKRKCSPLQFVHYHTVLCVFVLGWVLKPVLACHVHMLFSYDLSETAKMAHKGMYINEKCLHVSCLAQQIS